jgi:hypothetical protein
VSLRRHPEICSFGVRSSLDGRVSCETATTVSAATYGNCSQHPRMTSTLPSDKALKMGSGQAVPELINPDRFDRQSTMRAYALRRRTHSARSSSVPSHRRPGMRSLDLDLGLGALRLGRGVPSRIPPKLPSECGG